MVIANEIESVDSCLANIPLLLQGKRMILKRKDGYSAGKLTTTRNWCHILNGEIRFKLHLPDSNGQLKTWKLLARFNNVQPPPSPWIRPEPCFGKRPLGMISGDDVWGLAYEDISDWLRTCPKERILERLLTDLRTSFEYSSRRYC